MNQTSGRRGGACPANLCRALSRRGVCGPPSCGVKCCHYMAATLRQIPECKEGASADIRSYDDWMQWAAQLPTAQGIPKIVMQAWVTDSVPGAVTGHRKGHGEGGFGPRCSVLEMQWRRQCPEHTYVWLTEASARKFLQARRSRALAAFEALRPGAFKSDLLRYAWLAEHGGIYLDSDAAPTASMAGIHVTNISLVVARDNRLGFFLQNNFIAAAPRHPVMELALEIAVSQVERRATSPPPRLYGHFGDERDGALTLTGPGVLTAAWRTWTASLTPGPSRARLLQPRSIVPLHTHDTVMMLEEGPASLYWRHNRSYTGRDVTSRRAVTIIANVRPQASRARRERDPYAASYFSAWRHCAVYNPRRGDTLRNVARDRTDANVARDPLMYHACKPNVTRAVRRPPSAPHPPASRIDYTLSLQAQGHAFFDAFDFHTIDYNYGAAQYVTRDDAFATRLVDSSGPSSPPAESWAVVRIEDFLGAPSRTTAPRKRKSVKLISKRSWNRFLVRPSYAAHAKPFS